MLVNTRTYTRYRAAPDNVEYAGPDHSVSKVDLLSLRRIAPKITADSAGVARPSIKFEKSILNGTTGKTHKVIFTITSSIPVDSAVTTAMVDGMVADLSSLLGTADGKAVFNALDIEA